MIDTNLELPFQHPTEQRIDALREFFARLHVIE